MTHVVESSSELKAELAEDLDLIAEMTGAFARSRDVAETLKHGLARICGRLGAEAASVFLVDEDSGDLVCRACYGPTDVAGLRLAPGKGIVWRAVNDSKVQLVRDTRGDPDFASAVDDKTGFVTRTILCAPLAVHDERLGAIELFNKVGGGSFGIGDSRLLQALAASAAMALINTRLAAAMAEQEGLKRELMLAADIQRAMLPKDQPAEFPIHGLNLPARGVSGDFYDVVELPGGALAFTIGDVSGKGVNASLLMAKTASLFRCLCKRIPGPGDLLTAIDSELAETNVSGMFVTMVVGVYHPADARLVLANAGHEPPLVECGGVFRRLDEAMPPVGIDPALFAGGCPETVVDLAGATLYRFTDGLTEARGAGGQMLGSEGVERLVSRFRRLPVPRRLAALVAEAALDDSELKDDLTLLAVEGPR